jgi:DNA-binding XRE family transcriptional regulator
MNVTMTLNSNNNTDKEHTILALDLSTALLSRMISPLHCRAARTLLKWTVRDLAKAANLSPNTISMFENERASPNPATLTVIKLTFEQHGIEFLNGDAPGVRLKPR